ncbi:cytochrome c, class I [Candidatus Koribacter versatilis Ellin345]|uniref:Cytochrome c, class I n=1 Tax=Koribacter versatilis (strain Ellin345) TaxID=204669 RepID=Q1IPC7_KORVE|nr:cytochrome c, class I [Candidatus Koribacter versatilis Ellin345]
MPPHFPQSVGPYSCDAATTVAEVCNCRPARFAILLDPFVAPNYYPAQLAPANSPQFRTRAILIAGAGPYVARLRAFARARRSAFFVNLTLGPKIFKFKQVDVKVRLSGSNLLWMSSAMLVCLTFSNPIGTHAAPQASGSSASSVLEMDVIPRTPERLARGQYLVEGLLQCPACHSEVNFGKRPPEPMPGAKLGGHIFANAELGLPEPNRIVAPNISSDPEYGAGTWKDADFVRALRQGIGHDGRTLFPLMPYEFFRQLSDEDLAAAIVYIRSLPPVHHEQPKTFVTEDLKKTYKPFPMPASVAEPDRSDRVAYGKYLATAGHCGACHDGYDDKGAPIPGMQFSGGAPLTGPWEGGEKVISVNAANLTPDPSGIGYYNEAMFIEVIRNGGFKARPLSNIMPWSFFRNLTDDDLKSLFAYLQSLKPVCHHVDNTEVATYCKKCKTKHGLGEMNEETLTAK